jgi:hypothetical protein
MPDFNNMTVAELSAWYVDVVGYDLLKEDPSTSLEEFRATCVEFVERGNADKQNPEYAEVV